MIVILSLPAHIDHAVDRTRSAHHLAAGHVDLPAARTFVGLGFVAPVHGGIVDHLGGADRHDRPEMVRSSGAGLEQQHAIGAALAQPARHDGARRPCADDDEVISGVIGHGSGILLFRGRDFRQAQETSAGTAWQEGKTMPALRFPFDGMRAQGTANASLMRSTIKRDALQAPRDRAAVSDGDSPNCAR